MLTHVLSRPITAIASIALVGSLLSPGMAAAEPRAPRTASVLETGRAVAKRQAASLTAAGGSQATAAQPDLQSGSFFKTPVGVAVLVTFGVGVGYALYSASNDRIKSAGR